MVGITFFEAYIPAYRLSRDGISRFRGTRSLGGERAVAKYDEDSVTMAVAATTSCIKRSGLQADGVFFASTTSPYQEKQAATLVAAAGADSQPWGDDLGQRCLHLHYRKRSEQEINGTQMNTDQRRSK
jgi:3-hydroxy-3-methylglutaryl CoA synthase